MQEDVERIKRFIPGSRQLTADEQDKIVQFYEQRLEHLKQNPHELKNDMSIRGLPVFIVKGIK